MNYPEDNWLDELAKLWQGEYEFQDKFYYKYKKLEINSYILVNTCAACPEQYDVFKGDEKIGYLRLRHGIFRVDVPDSGGETIYMAEPAGDGCFDNDERDFYLREAVEAIDIYYNNQSDNDGVY